MNRFDGFLRWTWSILVVCTLAFAMSGCEGDDGRDGAAGTAGADGTDGADGAAGADGADGQSCWDLNGNGLGDLPDEDINDDGVVDVDDCSTTTDAIAMAQVESCGTCHGGAGDGHQGEYDKYTDANTFAVEIDTFTSVDIGGGDFTLTLDFDVTQNGAPYIDGDGLPSFESKSFYIVEYNDAAGEWYNPQGGFSASLSAGNAVSNGDGSYTLTETKAYDPLAFTGGALVVKLATGRLDIEDAQYNPGAGKRVQMFDETAVDAFAIGNLGNYESVANVQACVDCHGAPYRKHGNIDAVVAGAPDFTHCMACHNNTSAGGHPEWQHMVDNPLAWATGTPYTPEETALYAYDRTLVNDVHMSHAMEFPYPQSMASCVTCHEGKLTDVLDNSNFSAATCKSCHPVNGINAWPGEDYNDSHRAPALDYLWQRGANLTFHEGLLGGDCTGCHGAGNGRPFDQMHSGYDDEIYDDLGNRYADNNTVSIDGISYANDALTIDFSASDPAIVPEVLVSFYGWDTKDFIIASHYRDGSDLCYNSRSDTWGGCRYEFAPGDDNGLFTEDPGNVDGDWTVTADLTAFVPVDTDAIPTMILDGVINKVEVTLTPELELGGTEVALTAVTQTFDLGTGLNVSDYFKDGGAIVDTEKCNACHDQLGVTFHGGSGRGGEMTMCRNCHNTTFDGGHLEMTSRSIESYVHAIHSFQAFDTDDIFELDPGEVPPIVFDPVKSQHYAQHIGHNFPHFTALNCEGCHNPGTYDVPDQTKSMPGAISASYDVATWYDTSDPGVEDPAGRNMASLPSFVTGPASRACGGCHRADMIAEDDAGALVSFNAHTEAFGTLVEYEDDDSVLFGIIDKIMTLFE